MEEIICPYCSYPVDNVQSGPNGGILLSETYVLVADWIYHATCWNKQVEEEWPNE